MDCILKNLLWSDFKSLVDSKDLRVQYVELASYYNIFSVDGFLTYGCRIKITDPPGSDQTDFETNYKDDANLPLQIVDEDHTQIVVSKTTKLGWHFQPRSISFKTGTYNSLVSKSKDRSDKTDCLINFYETIDDELTLMEKGAEESEENYQIRLDSDCDRTEVIWHAEYDQDIIGALVQLKTLPSNSAYAWADIAPYPILGEDVSVDYLDGGLDLSYFTAKDVIVIDGKGPKTLNYDPVYKTNALRLIIDHDPGDCFFIQIIFQHFKE